MSGLSVSRLVRVTINLSPTAAATRSFGVLNVVGDSTVISGLERIRFYTSYDAVAEDLGVDAPESLAAQLYFGQTPQPERIAISRWIRTATSGFINGGVLTPSEQAIANFTAVTSGGFRITIDGVLKSLTALNFSGATTIANVISTINGSLTGAVISWTGTRFVVTSSTTGVSSLVTAASAPVSGTDISILLKLTSALASTPVPGYAAETPVQCAALLANLSSAWYGLQFAASTMPTDDQSIAVSAFIEALTVTRLYGVTTQDTDALDSAVTDDLASRMKEGEYKQSFIQYSSSSAYVIASAFGRAFAVDFNANRSTITLMYKQEPGVTAEQLTETQAVTLQDKRCNVFVAYDNDTMIIQYGVMSGPAWFDEIHGLDWLQNRIQTDVYNLLYTSPTKIPQTDEGQAQLMAAVQSGLDAAVNNGLVAPGIWTGPPIGQLKTGQYLKSGYYIYSQSFALQSGSDRAARKAPPIQVAVKLAGAIQEVDVSLLINR